MDATEAEILQAQATADVQMGLGDSGNGSTINEQKNFGAQMIREDLFWAP